MNKFYVLLTLIFLFSCEKEDTYINNYIGNEGILMDNYCALGASTASMKWQENVAKNLAVNYKNLAIGGTRWSQTPTSSVDLTVNASNNPSNKVMANQLARLLKEKELGYNPDLITILCGLNDAASGVSVIGNFEQAMALDLSSVTVNDWFTETRFKTQRETVYGATRFVIEQLIRNFPKSQIILILPQQVNNGTYNYQNVVAVNVALERLANRYSVIVIDAFKESGITDAGGLITQYLMADGLHPNIQGEILLTNFLTKRLRYYYFKKN